MQPTHSLEHGRELLCPKISVALQLSTVLCRYCHTLFTVPHSLTECTCRWNFGPGKIGLGTKISAKKNGPPDHSGKIGPTLKILVPPEPSSQIGPTLKILVSP